MNYEPNVKFKTLIENLIWLFISDISHPKHYKMGLEGLVPAGVVTGDNLLKLYNYCRDNSVALPAFNCTSTSTINAILQAARDINSPVIIQVR